MPLKKKPMLVPNSNTLIIEPPNILKSSINETAKNILAESKPLSKL